MSGNLRWVCAICVLCSMLFPSSVPAAPLTLEAALEAAVSDHPDLRKARAEKELALAERDIARSDRDASVDLEGILRSGRNSSEDSGFSADDSIRLTARKTLYDFGRSSNDEAAADLELSARETDLVSVLDRRRLDVMAKFFDVLLADMQYSVDNERLAVDYIQFDQGKDRLSEGQISSVDLAELESRYQDSLLERKSSDQRRRITRALLTNAMNQPAMLPNELEDPDLRGNRRALPDYEKLLPLMLDNNPRLRSQRQMLAAVHKRLESLRSETGPMLDAEAQAADYSRTTITRDRFSIGLILSWPLYQGGRADSRIALELAQIDKLQADTDQLKMELTQMLLETCLDISRLQDVAREAARKYEAYRDLQLERSRGLYELELKSNLGTAMVETAEANMRSRRVEYQLALSFARLEALLGGPLDPGLETGKDEK